MEDIYNSVITIIIIFIFFSQGKIKE
jgi:hypothetical protein